MSCTSPLTVAKTIVPLAVAPPFFSMNGSKKRTAAFIASADCNTKGSCIWPLPNRSPTTFMPSSKILLMISSAGYFSRAVVNSASSPIFSPSMM